ncbi:hypothetical protein GCM10010503_18870 [Streptomyces lucensis JCM 4490]|uniref:PAS domain S-box-containing protein n=1 Tax=Streptomyces lucensis JCM 4490 TaxID=1306176 RepID=A0A918MNU0_9ACTN|nr:PAS domain S-box protein [Streptomyces lucensis]GGW42636.1 hypothetical protein GCM10010503_18870 [Streptomyces lucensis JCM 4490]
MEEADFKALLAPLAMSWRESGSGPGVADSGGAAFDDPYATFADLAPAAAFVRDVSGRYLWVNHAYARLYGTTRDAVIGRHLADVGAAGDTTRFLSLDQEVLARGRPVRHTLAYRRADGRPGCAAGYRFPVRWGAARCVAGIYVDVTDHAQAPDRRRQAEADLQALRDHSGLLCVRLTPDGRISEAGTAVADVLRIRLSDLAGLPADTLLAGTPERSALYRVWDDLVSGRRRSARACAVLVDRDGWRRRVRIHLSTVCGTASGVSGVWAVGTRLGPRHRAQPDLTAAQIRILALLAAGHSNADIAGKLCLSRQTLDYHLSRLRVLLDAATRPALVARAYVLGILSAGTWPPRSSTAVNPASPV